MHLNNTSLAALLALIVAVNPVAADSSKVDTSFVGHFGPFLNNQLPLPEAVGPYEAGFNPATLDLAIAYQTPPHFNSDLGRLGLRGGFGLNWGTGSLIGRTSKKEAIRFSGTVLGSNRGSYPTISPNTVKVTGEGVELAYAYRLINQPHSVLTVGGAWSPQNRIHSQLFTSDRLVASGEIKTSLQGRLGLLWQDNRGTRIGLAGSYDAINQTTRVIGSEASRSQLHQQLMVVGASHRFKSGTTVYANCLWFGLNGEDFAIHTTGHSVGISQELGKRWVLGFDHTGKGVSGSLVYLGNGWNAYLVQGAKNFSHTEGIFGQRGNFTGMGISVTLK